MILGTLLGALLAATANRYRIFGELLNPLAITIAAIPAVVIVSVLNNMYSITTQTGRRVMVTLAVFFIVFVQVARGLRQNHPTQLELMRSYAATPREILRKSASPTPSATCSRVFARLHRSPSSSPWSPSTSAGRRTASGNESPATSASRGPRSPLRTSSAGPSSGCCSSPAPISWNISPCHGIGVVVPGDTHNNILGGEIHMKPTTLKSRGIVRSFAAMSAAGLLVAACGSSAKTAAPATTSATTTTRAATTVVAGSPSTGATTATAGSTAGSTGGSSAGTTPGTTAAGGGAATGGLKVDASKCTAPTGQTVKLQLQWVAQSQFAATTPPLSLGYFKDAGINVSLIETPDTSVVPVQQVATGAVDFAVSWFRRRCPHVKPAPR